MITFLVDKLSQLVGTLNGTKVCEGNSDEEFTSLPNIRKSMMKNQSSKQPHDAIFNVKHSVLL